jgi:hypothetical protein
MTASKQRDEQIRRSIHSEMRRHILAARSGCRLTISGVGVEKLDLRKNGMILGDGKWSIAPYESLIGHPNATLFWTSSCI